MRLSSPIDIAYHAVYESVFYKEYGSGPRFITYPLVVTVK